MQSTKGENDFHARAAAAAAAAERKFTADCNAE